MRRRRYSSSYLYVFVALMLLMSLPRALTESLRGAAVGVFSPLWQQLTAIKGYAADGAFSGQEGEELQKLRIENTLLRNEIGNLKEMMLRELKLVAQLAAASQDSEVRQTSSFLTRRHRMELQKLLELQLQAIPGHVIFRPSSAWNSSLWIDLGESTNESLGKVVIAKNSPVLLGRSVVGVVDYVGKYQSRVSLITDSKVTPSVRAVRDYHSALLQEKIETLLPLLDKENEYVEVAQSLNELSKKLRLSGNPQYLAKGEISGSGKPLWRAQRHLLKGTGFNYDFADGEGPARDLRSGLPVDPNSKEKAIPILKEGDLLLTTGMDGVFPPNLLVAEVTVVHPLKEGDYYYELEALPATGNMDDLSLVFVIPPVGYDASERPPLPGWD